MTPRKQQHPQKKPGTKPGSVHDVHEEKRQASTHTGKPTIDPNNDDENVGQRRSQDEPFVIPPPHDEVE